VVVIMTDDQDAASMPAMRKLNGLPYGSWATFRRAYCNTALCAPSRATLLTGRYCHQHGVEDNNQGNRLDHSQTLYTWLAGAGYRVGVVGKHLHWDAEKKRRYLPGVEYWSKRDGSVQTYTDRARAWMDEGGQPFALFVNLRDPHDPYRVEAQYADAAPYVPADGPAFNQGDVGQYPAALQRPRLGPAAVETTRRNRLQAQRELLSVDDCVQALLDDLGGRGVLENTLVIFASDNGYSWGDHRWRKKRGPWEECHRIPLLLRVPGIANMTIDRPVSMVDLTATILEWCGVGAGLPQMGLSLLPLTANAEAWTPPVYLRSPVGPVDYEGLVTPGGLKLVKVEGSGGGRLLFNLVVDPHELVNLAGAYPDIVGELENVMEALRGRA
jgi:arylsulfatase A-like enzyme